FFGPSWPASAYYVITRGQEVGIFYDWNDVAERVNHVSGSRFKKYNTFDKALEVYTTKYNEKKLHPVPQVGGPFWPSARVLASPTASEEELWTEVDGLSQCS
ncbi:hypothetical protein OG21DRAFT_1526587, partial [Imleria badia]